MNLDRTTRKTALPWVLFAVAAATVLLLLLSTVALATVKSVPVAGPTVTATVRPAAAPARTVTAAPLPAKTITVTDDAQVAALRAQLGACNQAWIAVAKAEQEALTEYSDATQTLVAGVQESDVSKITAAGDGIQRAGEIVRDVTPDVTAANETCTP